MTVHDLVKDKYRDLYKYDLLKDTVDFLENMANNPIYERCMFATFKDGSERYDWRSATS